MKTLSKLVSTSSISLLVITSPVLISGSHKKINFSNATATVAASNYTHSTNTSAERNFKYTASAAVAATTTTVETKKETDVAMDAAAKKAMELKMTIIEATSIYESMKLSKSGLNQKAFEYAWRGYHNLVKKGTVTKTNVLSICDFTQSSRRKRLYVIDVANKKLLYNTYVSHGMNSGVEYATSFSNRPESFKTSLGFYLTTKTYTGRNGLSLKVTGLEKGYNNLAAKRGIVLHGSDYISYDYLKNNGEMGRSLGCTAIPNAMNGKIIKSIKNGSLFFIYHPTKKYLNESTVING
ncbi:MAG: murein L,D-transpeptidase catalytic domain family protein [Bacteroidetes bacterium]|nr:murein L,D-transpeptidase catalytic domain family protein [Bacteroidota bacterium]